MKLRAKILIVAALAAAAAGVMVAKNLQKETPANIASSPVAAQKKLPRLLEIGSTKCVPCQMMAPVLDELKKEYAGKLEVDFIDAWKDKSAAAAYGILAIPTQIFFGFDGRELYRHEGFFPKDEILTKWKQLGVELNTAPKPAAK